MDSLNSKLRELVIAVNHYKISSDEYEKGELQDYILDELGQLEVDFMLDKIKLDGESLKYTQIIYDFVESLERKQTND